MQKSQGPSSCKEEPEKGFCWEASRSREGNKAVGLCTWLRKFHLSSEDSANNSVVLRCDIAVTDLQASSLGKPRCHCYVQLCHMWFEKESQWVPPPLIHMIQILGAMELLWWSLIRSRGKGGVGVNPFASGDISGPSRDKSRAQSSVIICRNFF